MTVQGVAQQVGWQELVGRTVRAAIGVDDVIVHHGTDRVATVRGRRPRSRLTVVAPHSGEAVTVELVRDAGSFTEEEHRLAERLLVALGDPGAPALTSGAVERRTERVAALAERCLHELDDMVHVATPGRLRSVAECFADGLDAASWWVGRQRGAGRLQVVDSHVRRGTDVTVDDGWLGILPARVLEGRSTTLHLRPRHEAEAWELGTTTVLAAGGYDPDAEQWVACLVHDGPAPGLAEAQAAWSALVHAALGFPRTPGVLVQ
ncbi:MAG TPA: hypothetical protein VGE77_11255 [Nocardioides sp.]